MISEPIPEQLSGKPIARPGALVISLDFELHWGVRDQREVAAYRDNLLGVREVVPAMLDLFTRRGIHATWATVGFLFFENRKELLAGLPDLRPQYVQRQLSPYDVLDTIGDDEQNDPFHYAPSLIRQIAVAAGQEIGSHTFSHYYCLEQGQNAVTFRADLEAACRAAARFDVELKSLVFPRNQFRHEYLSVLGEMGFECYRGNLRSFLYEARSNDEEALWRRGVRFLDAYVPISGTNSYPYPRRVSGQLCDVPASRFLRPVNMSPHAALRRLHLSRILRDLSFAARTGRAYHLYWHPHNFGADPRSNLEFLNAILEHFSKLREKHGMLSLNMGEIAALASKSVPA